MITFKYIKYTQYTISLLNIETHILQKFEGVIVYSGPSLSGHSQQRLPSLMWLQIFGATTLNAFTMFTSPFCQRPPL